MGKIVLVVDDSDETRLMLRMLQGRDTRLLKRVMGSRRWQKWMNIVRI